MIFQPSILSALLRLRDRVSTRPPDVVIGGEDNPYLLRWFVIPKNRWFNVYLHRFMRSDDDRALHDHPWATLSIVIDGAYDDLMIAAGGVHHRVRRAAGSIVARSARAAHRIEVSSPCWTIFITGPRVRSWGFHCPGGWVHWRDFTNPLDSGRTVGRGCAALDRDEASR